MIIIGVIFIIPFYIIESFNTTYLPSTGLDLAIIGYVAVLQV